MQRGEPLTRPTMTPSPRVLYTDLAPDEAVALLARNGVGRLAFTFHDRVDIEPISYTYDNGWLYGRTSKGAKFVTVKHHPWVALQVDEVRSEQDWISVVVHGTFYVLEPSQAPNDPAAFDLALSILSRRNPDAFTAQDAAPHRNVVFRIHVGDITGRKAEPVPGLHTGM